MNDEDSDLGRVAYDAYCEHAKWKDHKGNRLQTWDEIPEYRREHWAAAARAVRIAVS